MHLFRFIMITLLAESKTMGNTQSPISREDFIAHTPFFETQADSIMEYIASLPPSQIASNLGISNQLAVKAHNLAYDFPHKLTGYKALNAFIGEAFRAFDVTTLPEETIEFSYDKLRIVSSVYGLLKPDDIIKPYRCEFNKTVSADHKTPIQIYKPKITVDFVKFIKENKIRDVINLLPGDADKCFDWKIIRAYTKVHKICFQALTSEGKLKTPIAKRLKELRGLMARIILEQKIESFDDLKKAESHQFIFSPQDSKPLLPVFITTE